METSEKHLQSIKFLGGKHTWHSVDIWNFNDVEQTRIYSPGQNYTDTDSPQYYITQCVTLVGVFFLSSTHINRSNIIISTPLARPIPPPDDSIS